MLLVVVGAQHMRMCSVSILIVVTTTVVKHTHVSVMPHTGTRCPFALCVSVSKCMPFPYIVTNLCVPGAGQALEILEGGLSPY